MRFSFFGVACFIAVAACGGTTETTGSAGTAPTPDASTAPAPTSSATPTEVADAAPPPKPTPKPTPTPTSACNAIVDDGPVATAQRVAANAPTPTGGAIADGKYHLVDVTLYTGAGGTNGPLAITVTTTFELHGNTVQASASGPNGVARATASFATNANKITWNELCPVPGGSTGTYSAGASELTIFMENDLDQIAGSKYALVH